MSLKTILKKTFVSSELENQLEKMQKPVGSFGYDPWGYNNETMKVTMSLYRYIYNHYFRVTAHGLSNIPAKGRVLLIPNHSGQIPFDGTLVGMAMALESENPRAARVMIERFFPTVPFIGNFMNMMGGVIGDPVNCSRMLEREEAVMVFPEGIRGSGKPFRKRYNLQRFGNGFMHLAMAHKTPVIPVGIVGCEESILTLGNFKPLAKLLAIPYVPVALPVLLPTKVYINIGKPMYFEGNEDSEDEVTEKVNQVMNEIRLLIDKGLSERRGWFR